MAYPILVLQNQSDENGTYNISDLSGQDYSDFPYLGSIKEVAEWEVVIKSLLFAVIIFFSIIGNFLIILVVLRNRSMRTTTNYYIVNLAVADLLVTVCCMWVTLVADVNEGWVLGAFFCKINTFMQVLSVIASVLSLTLIAYDRFFGIVFALKAHMTDRRARTSLILIWICSGIIACPTLIFRELKIRVWKDHVERWCDDEWPVLIEVQSNVTTSSMPSRTAYYVTVSVVLYFIPMIVMTLAYSRIIMKLWMSAIPVEKMDKRVEAQARARKKVIVMLVAILVVFAVCWMPYQIILLYSEVRTTRDQLGEWYFNLQFAACFMAYSNSALNPLIYTGFNENFRRGIQRVWNCISCKEKANMYHNGYSYGQSYGSHDATMPTSL